MKVSLPGQRVDTDLSSYGNGSFHRRDQSVTSSLAEQSVDDVFMLRSALLGQVRNEIHGVYERKSREPVSGTATGPTQKADTSQEDGGTRQDLSSGSSWLLFEVRLRADD
jgi:hypothetical protein